MLLRVRLPSGLMKRITVADDTSQATLEVQIQQIGELNALPSLFTDQQFTKPFALSRAKHGDMVFVHREIVPATEAGVGAAVDATMTDVSEAKDTETSENSDVKRTKREPCDRCFSANGMCEHCAPKEDKHARYKAELAKWKGRGMSLAVMEALEALKPKIKPQEEAHATAVCVDSAAGHAFQAYLGMSGFSQHRFGLCYGKVSAEKEVEVHLIYEPPQAGDSDAYALNDDLEDRTRADKLAKMLGFSLVGIVFSARQRKAVLAGRDVVVAARIASTLGEEERKTFIIIKVGVVSDGGETAFESYQISDLAHELYAQGDVFAPEAEQKANSGKVACAREVIIEGRDARKIHTEFFLNNVPIRALDSWLRCEFPVENRELRPQRGADIAACTSGNAPYWKRIADFHLLLYLTGTFGIDTDMPSIVAAILAKEEIEEGYKLMIQTMAAA